MLTSRECAAFLLLLACILLAHLSTAIFCSATRDGDFFASEKSFVDEEALPFDENDHAQTVASDCLEVSDALSHFLRIDQFLNGVVLSTAIPALEGGTVIINNVTYTRGYYNSTLPFSNAPMLASSDPTDPFYIRVKDGKSVSFTSDSAVNGESNHSVTDPTQIWGRPDDDGRRGCDARGAASTRSIARGRADSSLTRSKISNTPTAAPNESRPAIGPAPSSRASGSSTSGLSIPSVAINAVCIARVSGEA